MACVPPYCHGTGDWCGCNCRCCPPPCCDLIRLTYHCGSHTSGCGLGEESFECVCDGPVLGGFTELAEFPTFDQEAFLFSLKDNELAAQLFGGPSSVPCSVPCQPIYVDLITDGCCLEILGGTIYAVGSGIVSASIAASPDCGFCGANGPTISTDCCGEIPEILAAKISSSGGCCLDYTTTFEFSYDIGLDLWTAELEFCETTLGLELYCDSELGWVIVGTFGDACTDPLNLLATETSCDPFILNFEFALNDCGCELEGFSITVSSQCTTSAWMFSVEGITDGECSACELLNCSRWYLNYDPVFECLWESAPFSFCECPGGTTPREDFLVQWVLERFSETEYYLSLGNIGEDCYFYVWYGEVDPNYPCCGPVTLTLVDADNTSCLNIPEVIEIFPMGCETLVPTINGSPGSVWADDCDVISVTLGDGMCCECCLADISCTAPHDEMVFIAQAPFLASKMADGRRGKTIVNVRALRDKIAKRAKFSRRRK